MPLYHDEDGEAAEGKTINTAEKPALFLLAGIFLLHLGFEPVKAFGFPDANHTGTLWWPHGSCRLFKLGCKKKKNKIKKVSLTSAAAHMTATGLKCRRSK